MKFGVCYLITRGFLLLGIGLSGKSMADARLQEDSLSPRQRHVIKLNEDIQGLAEQKKWTEILKYVPQVGDELGRSLHKPYPSLLNNKTINFIGQAYGKAYFQNYKGNDYRKEGQLFFVYCISILSASNVSENVKKSIQAWNQYYTDLDKRIISQQFTKAASLKRKVSSDCLPDFSSPKVKKNRPTANS